MMIDLCEVRFARVMWTLCCGAGLSLGLIGCGGDDGPRQFNVNGTVIYDGEPLQAGRLSFLPDSDRGNSGPVGYAIIQDGKYDTRSVGGKASISGPIKVYITGYDNSGGGEAEPNPPLFEDYQFEVDIDPEKKVTTLDFDVPKQGK